MLHDLSLRLGVRPAARAILADLMHAQRALVAAGEPRIDTMAVEVMPARKPAETVSFHKIRKAYCATAGGAGRRGAAVAKPKNGQRGKLICRRGAGPACRLFGWTTPPEERAEDGDCDECPRARQEDDGCGEGPKARAGTARPGMDEPDNAEHEPAVDGERDCAAETPRRSRRVPYHRRLHLTVSERLPRASCGADVREQSEANGHLEELQRRLHKQPPTQRTVTAAAALPAARQEDNGSKRGSRCAEEGEQHHGLNEPRGCCRVTPQEVQKVRVRVFPASFVALGHEEPANRRAKQ